MFHNYLRQSIVTSFLRLLKTTNLVASSEYHEVALFHVQLDKHLVGISPFPRSVQKGHLFLSAVCLEEDQQ
jgi:hypothetical protein